ncbi:MAG: RluA family pseudouridine synthase [Tissierellia bacterium]|nr:RluA family pseudouridine synthase [Tissierellia bacterium]
MQEIHVHNEDKQRLDSYLATKLEDLSRTYIHKLIKEGLIHVNGKIVKPRYMVKEGDIIQVELPLVKKIELVPENIPIDIIYEDGDIVIVNKPKAMIVHPVEGNCSGTLVNALLYHVGESSLSSSDTRPGIVHRLDKDTTGLLVIAKHDKAYKNLSQQFIDQSVERIYTTLVYGGLDIEEAIIDAPIGRDPANRTRMIVIDKNSKEATTHYKVLEQFEGYTLLKVSLKTGRTHQIRVHMKYIGHPVVGDPIYSSIKNEFNMSTQLLHANRLAFYHPGNGKYMEFEAELPEDFKAIIKLLKKRRR